MKAEHNINNYCKSFKHYNQKQIDDLIVKEQRAEISRTTGQAFVDIFINILKGFGFPIKTYKDGINTLYKLIHDEGGEPSEHANNWSNKEDYVLSKKLKFLLKLKEMETNAQKEQGLEKAHCTSLFDFNLEKSDLQPIKNCRWSLDMPLEYREVIEKIKIVLEDQNKIASDIEITEAFLQALEENKIFEKNCNEIYENMYSFLDRDKYFDAVDSFEESDAVKDIKTPNDLYNKMVDIRCDKKESLDVLINHLMLSPTFVLALKLDVDSIFNDISSKIKSDRLSSGRAGLEPDEKFFTDKLCLALKMSLDFSSIKFRAQNNGNIDQYVACFKHFKDDNLIEIPITNINILAPHHCMEQDSLSESLKYKEVIIPFILPEKFDFLKNKVYKNPANPLFSPNHYMFNDELSGLAEVNINMPKKDSKLDNLTEKEKYYENFLHCIQIKNNHLETDDKIVELADKAPVYTRALLKIGKTKSSALAYTKEICNMEIKHVFIDVIK